MTKVQDIRNQTQRTNGTRSVSSVTTIVRHPSATATGNFLTFWRYWNGTLGWGTGGYHEIILRDGTVQLCYNPNEITNGVGGQNNYTYHISLVGNGSFTEAQEKAWDERVAYNMKRLNISVNNVKGHSEMPGANTSCPGINMNTVRDRIRNGSSKPSSGLSISQVAEEVRKGLWGNNPQRERDLTAAGYDAQAVQRRVNELESGSTNETATPAPSRPAGNQTTGSIVTYLDSIDVDSSYDNRARLARDNGIRNYSGTASQNTQLLNILRGSGTSNPSNPTKEYVQLPASAQTWRTYKTNVQPVAKNSDWSLTPSAFGGLEYEILARPQSDVVTINTSRGRRNIYIGSNTSARVVKK